MIGPLNDWDYGTASAPFGAAPTAETTRGESSEPSITSLSGSVAGTMSDESHRQMAYEAVTGRPYTEAARMQGYTTKDSGSKDTFSTGYQRDCSVGKGAHEQLPFFALTRDAALYERGAVKYGPSNWMKGAPFSRTMQSALRHLFQYMMGDRSEDHLAACRWGCAAVMTYEAMIERGLLPKDLDDLPRYDSSTAHKPAATTHP